jgi:hypothetical protein
MNKFLRQIILIVFLPTCLMANEKVISLQSYYTEVELHNYYFEDIINVTGEVHYLGFVLSSVNFDKEPIRFEKDLSTELKSYLNPLFRKKEIGITLRINKIFNYEILTSEGTQAFSEMNLSFLVKEGEYYSEIYRSAITAQGRKHKKIIMDAIDASLYKFEQRANRGKLDWNLVSAIEIDQNPILDFNYSKFNETNRSHTKGIFWDFDDYFYNTPDTNSDFLINYKEKISNGDKEVLMVHAIPKLKSDSIKVRNSWGFSDGERIFVKVGTKFIPLKETDEGIFLDVQLRLGNNKNSIAFDVLFGAIGGAIVGLVSNESNSIVSKGTLLKYDLSSNNFDFFIDSKDKKIESKFIFYSSYKNETELSLYLNDDFICRLKNDSWCEVNFPSSISEIKVALKSTQGTMYENVVPNRLFYENIYLCYERKKNQPFFRKHTESAAEEAKKSLNKENRVNTILIRTKD